LTSIVAAEDLLSLAVLRGVGGSKPAARRWRHHILQPVPLVSFLCGDAGSKKPRRQRGADAVGCCVEAVRVPAVNRFVHLG